MCTGLLLTGTLLTVLLEFPPACSKQSEELLVVPDQPVITVNFAEGLTATTPLMGLVPDDDQIPVRLSSSEFRWIELREVEGNVQDGYVLVPSPPPKCVRPCRRLQYRRIN